MRPSDTYICLSKLTIIVSDNGLSLSRRQAIIWTNAEILLTHWGRVTYICVGKLTTIASDNGLSPGRCQAIIWTNAGILLIGPLAINFSEILSKIQIFSLKKMYLKLSSACRLRLGLNVLMGPQGTDFNEILMEIHTFSLKKIHLKTPSGTWWPFCLCPKRKLPEWPLLLKDGQ